MRLVILASPGASTDMLVNYLEDHGCAPVAVLVEPAQSRRALLRGRVRRLGWWAVLGQVLFLVGVLPLLRRGVDARLAEIRKDYGLRPDPVPPDRITPIPSVNSAEARAHLDRLAPDAVVLNGTRIVKDDTLQAARAPVLNIHAGITPAFRGVHGGYWALWTGQPQDFGATVHMVDTGVDTGAVLAHLRLRPSAKDNFATYPLLQLGAALPALVETLNRLRKAEPLSDPLPTQGSGRQWYHPTVWQYLFGRLRGVR